jgi:hypothetical protein
MKKHCDDAIEKMKNEDDVYCLNLSQALQIAKMLFSNHAL